MKIVAIAVGGAIGALLRYLVAGQVGRVAGVHFPWGTLVVNLTGAFGIGLLNGLFEKWLVSPHLKTFLLIGLLGAFTTFSTFGLETVRLIQGKEIDRALLYLFLSNGLGLLLVFVGLKISRWIQG